MRLQPFHPLAFITLSCLIVFFAFSYISIDPAGQDAAYLTAITFLSSPLMVLLYGQLTLAHTWKRNAFLCAGSLLFAFLCMFASFLMRWFKLGMGGAIFFGIALALIAGLYLLLALLIRETSL